eukprot:TRINITY_DN77181_c0_g1_i1.p1 TRINITY_DN77181_c0_g1~~TRINITY_DN77181_c0_g1_i1.p1  ORF type:complete len:201 (+),score=31.87 TRINITY_DN77181_c0_g1_i1:87-689(+)
MAGEDELEEDLAFERTASKEPLTADNPNAEWAAYLACFAFCEATDEEDLLPQPVEVSPGVFLGGITEALNLEGLESRGITRVLCMAPSACGSISYPSEFEVLDIDAEDQIEYDLFSSDMPRALAFISKHVSEGHRVLVHCYAGMNRSATVCAAWLLHHDRRLLVDVVRHLAHKRGLVLQNESFIMGLVELARLEGLLQND